MIKYKELNNGIRLIINKIDGLLSVSCGVLVKTGCINENALNNGISHFIEHTVFKGTDKRTAFQISEEIDGIGAQINAFTSKELTCYYTKSTSDHLSESMEVLSDIFFNSTFKKEELDKEKGVIIEEINMSEDTPEDLCFDLLSASYYGDTGLGRTILGSAKNIRRFTDKDVKSYMSDYYTADNIVLSIAGNVDIDNVVSLADKFFSEYQIPKRGKPQVISLPSAPRNLFKSKKIEQTHISMSLPAYGLKDERSIALNIANISLGGGMSSRLFQSIRENSGLCYNVYSCISQYKDSGVTEIYAGVSNEMRDTAFDKIVQEIENFKNGITEREFSRSKEQLKSSFIMGQESTSSQMILFGRYLLFFDEVFDFSKRIEDIDKTTINSVNGVIKDLYELKYASTATVGPKRTPLKI